MTRYLRNADRAELAKAMVRELFALLKKLPVEHAVLALPGGRSIMPFVECFVSLAVELPAVVWKRLHIFMVDERLVPLAHEDSNFRAIFTVLEALVSSGVMERSQFHPFMFVPATDDLGVGLYESELKRLGGRFHVTVVGVGEDAHIAALFPSHHSVRDNSPYFITMSDSPKPPPARMTASRALITASDAVFGLFLGEAKADAFQEFENNATPPESCPAKLILSVPNPFVVTDLPSDRATIRKE